MEHRLVVPVQANAAGTLVLRIGRLPSGERIGLAFTSEDSLVRILGPAQQWTDIAWSALFELLEPLGVEHILVDPDSADLPRSAAAA